MRRVLAALAVVAFLSPAAFAANPLDVVINEVAWMGSQADSGDEWIELYNNTAVPVDLTGWTIDDDGVAVYALSGTISANGYFLIEKIEAATDVPADLIDASISLANTGDDLVLIDELANPIDTVASGGAWYAGTNNGAGVQDVSMERRGPLLPGTDPLNWGDNDGVTVNGLDSGAVALIATPKAENSIFGIFGIDPTIAHVHCVDETHIEVYFDTDIDPVSGADPLNFTIDFMAGGAPVNPTTAFVDGVDATKVHLTGIIGFATEDLLTLTVDGLLSTTGGTAVAQTADYAAGVVSIAWARTDADASFIPDLLEAYPDLFVTIQGVANAVGVFTGAESSMQDATGGITIFDSAATGAIVEGDEIRISGNLDQFNGKFEIVNTALVVISSGNILSPDVVTLATFLANAESYESMFVGVAAVTNTMGGDPWPAAGSSANLEITDDGGTSLVILRVDSDTDIDEGTEPVWPVDIQGIAGQFDTGIPPNTGYQVLPRATTDLGVTLPSCSDGQTRPCYTGDPALVGHGECAEGLETCVAGAWDGICVGEVLPAADDSVCNGLDEDCDDAVDEDVDTQTDPLNCGTCGNDCTTQFPNATGLCTAGACEIGSCDAGFLDCDGDLASCETAIGTDTACAGCADDCTAIPNAAGSTCDTSGAPVCAIACDANFDDCDGDPVTGCETSLGTDSDCAACNDDCTVAFPNATGSCNLGACGMGACDADYEDCDLSFDSCETSLTTTTDCGTCGNACAGGESCIDPGTGVWGCDASCPDADGDGAADDTCGGSDCDDTNPAINPSATEVCDDVDNNCDAAIDEGFDVDGDTYKSCGAAADCDDDNPAINPGATEVCDGVDNNCDAAIDEGFDLDGDTYTTCATPAPDCDDADPLVNPGAAEICDDVDNNCDAVIDEGFDGKGDSCDGPDADTCDNGTSECNAAGDALECVGDTPAVEACDGLDNDCDTEVDEDWPTLGDACDGTDGDECANGQLVCNAAGNGVECNENPTQNQEELCNGTDDDCDGEVDEGFETYTCGVGACQVTVEVCLDGEYQSCVPLDAPEAVEVTCEDGVDNDCDGYADDEDLDCTGGGGGGGGCDCSVSAGRTSGGFALVLFGLVALLRRRRQ